MEDTVRGMKVYYTLYILATSLLAVLVLPFFILFSLLSGRFSQHFAERLGVIPSEVVNSLSNSPRIWIHAASLGEVKVAESIIKSLKGIIPECSIIVSTFTEHGRQLAIEILGPGIPVIYAPIDLIISVRKSLSLVRPDVMVFLETEIWPAWTFEARRMGIKTVLINGRLSAKSIKRYLRIRPFFRYVLENFQSFSMISQDDANRIKAMGADSGKIEVHGNAKYDLLSGLAKPPIEREMRDALNLDPSDRVLIAGSTRNGEEVLLLDAYEKILEEFPTTIFIIVPRHIDKVPTIASLAKRRGLGYQLRTDLGRKGRTRTERIVIFNTFGELFNAYSVGTLVFCGGSLVPFGGQNPLEPAAWGKVVIYGPSMENFLDAKALLENAGAGINVANSRELAETVSWLFRHPEEIENRGNRGLALVRETKGNANRHAGIIMRLLQSSQRGLNLEPHQGGSPP